MRNAIMCVSHGGLMLPLPEANAPMNDTEKWGEQACV